MPSARSMSGSAAPARPCFRFAQQVAAADCDHFRRRVRRRVHLQRSDPYELLRRYDDRGRALFFTAGMLARSGSASRGADQPPHRPWLQHDVLWARPRKPAAVPRRARSQLRHRNSLPHPVRLPFATRRSDTRSHRPQPVGPEERTDAMKFILMPFSLAVAPVLAGWQLLSFSTTTAKIVLLRGRYA